MEIIRKFLTSAELYPPNTRYNEGTDTVQVTPDGGATWQDAPGFDPRITSNLPPPDTAQPACDAATRIQQHFEQILATVIVGAGSAAIAVAGRIVSLFMPQFALIITFVSTVVGGLLGIGAEALAAAFLGDEWETFICILRCGLTEDGTMTEEGLAQVRVEVDDQIGGTAAAALQLLMTMTGAGGMNAAASQRSETGDCDECPSCEWCYTFDFTADDGDFLPNVYTSPLFWQFQPAWSSGQGWSAGQVRQGTGNNRWQGININRTLPASAHVTELELEYSIILGQCSTGTCFYAQLVDNVGTVKNENLTTSGTKTLNWTGSRTMTGIAIGVQSAFCTNACTPSGAVVVTRLTMRGTGDNPFGVDNC